LSFIARCAGGIIPNQSTAAQFGLSFLAPSRLHRAKWPGRFDPRSFLNVFPSLGPFGRVLL
jgi:hypothetical protein